MCTVNLLPAGYLLFNKVLTSLADGNLLMGLTEEQQLREEPFNIENGLHRRAILAALERVKERGAKPPRDLWEYKVTISKIRFFQNKS